MISTYADHSYLRMQVSARMQTLVTSWHSAKVVRTREKVSFFFGVMSLLVSALLFGMAPEYGPFLTHD